MSRTPDTPAEDRDTMRPEYDFSGAVRGTTARRYAQGAIRQPSEEERAEWEADFEAASRRPLAERLDYGFVRTFRPVLDEGPGIRMFDTMADYREWCNRELPGWLGFRSGD